MKKTLRLLTLLLATTAVFFFGTAFAKAVCSDIEEGTNAGAENYSVRSQTVKSYLEPLSDGRLMRVQGSGDGTVYAEYYDASFNFTSKKRITAELPVFGGFYSSGSHYYILSGQNNFEEDDSTEVYRITKYDLNWNRLSSCGLYGANTYIPFDAGSARMTMCGKYLLIRTCHEMYQSDDGLHHQANVTIEADTENMTVTDSFCGILNSSYGYASHSFNQFIQTDGNHIVAVDHGDAYPRSICLFKYQSDCSGGTFQSYTATKSFLDLYGAVGMNTTNASVGGFEVTDTHYLVAGNSIVQDGSARKTRNIFVSAVGRNDVEKDTPAAFRFVTDYAEGTESPSTPQLVSLQDGRYLLLWECGGKVWYCALNGSGEAVSAVYSMEGALSDCVPVLYNGQAVWYVYHGAEVTFCGISTSDLSKHTRKTVDTGHHWSVVSRTEDGAVELKCSDCGKTRSGVAPTQVQIYWKTENGGYSTYVNTDVTDNTALEMLVSCGNPQKDITLDAVKVTAADPAAAEIDQANGTVRFLKAGKVTIRAEALYNPEAFCEYSFNVSHVYGKAKVIPATMTEDGATVEKCGGCGKEIRKVIPKIESAKIEKVKYVYSGKALKPKATVKDRTGKTLEEGKDYSVAYKKNKNVGTASAVITFKGSYSGSKTLSFKIIPRQVKGLKADSVKKTSLKVHWTADKATSYYRLEYSTDGKTWKTVKTTEKTACTVKKLKAGRKYQFRVVPLDSTKKITGKKSAVLKTGTLTEAPSVTLTSKKSKKATVTWKKVKGASKYIVYKSANGKKWTKVVTTKKTSYTFTKQKGGKKLYVRVRAVNAYGKASAYSRTKSVTVKK